MTVVDARADERVMVLHVGWHAYEAILADHEDCSSPRFTYDRGVLEIMSPSGLHDVLARLAGHLVAAIVDVRGLDMADFGSTTCRNHRWERGFEPDSCFYLRDAATMRGVERVDTDVHPAPEIVFEVDITRSSIDKLALYAQFGVAEVWRHGGRKAAILILDGSAYRRTDRSVALPGLDAAALTGLLAEGRSMSRPQWLRSVREWVARPVT
ncbi:MAG: Uma2 family endonuclease [Pseudonocardia sp.]